jgi:cell division GTPase FtsZ
VKSLFRRDVTLIQKTNPRHAERLRRAVTTRFLDTNEFSLADVAPEERVLIGPASTRRLGSMHNPEVARDALEASRREVESLLAQYSVVVVIGTGGKGTGAGTMFSLAQMARTQKKLVIPIFVVPSFERHEVEKRRYDHALEVVDRFDEAKIRLIEILNDRGYVNAQPEPQGTVWERMNLPIARALRGILYVLGDLSQVDPSDLSMLFAGNGRLRLGFAELDPPAGQEPSDEQVHEVGRACWDNPYCAFEKPVGTSLICIQGEWSNVVDGKIKGRLAAHALEGAFDSPYNPLYARSLHAPKPWGVTALFAEYTGKHAPLEIAWPPVAKTAPPERTEVVTATPETDAATLPTVSVQSSTVELLRAEQDATVDGRPFSTFREFCLALQRLDPSALALASRHDACPFAIEGAELRKLLGTIWFRSILPRLSKEWRDQILEVLVGSITVPNHGLRVGRQTVPLSELGHDQLKEILAKTLVPDEIRADLDLLVTAGNVWGEGALRRFAFSAVLETSSASRLSLLLQPFRGM